MKIGQKVKVKVQSGRRTGGDEWKKGIVLSSTMTPDKVEVYTVGVGEPHYFNYVEEDFYSHDIKSLEEISDEDHQANIARDMPIGWALAKAAYSALLPDEVVVYKDADGVISGYHGGVTISPVVHEYPRIGALMEKTAYQVTVWTQQAATRVQPEEVHDSVFGVYPTIQQAVSAFMEAIFKLKNADYWQNNESPDWGSLNYGPELR